MKLFFNLKSILPHFNACRHQIVMAHPYGICPHCISTGMSLRHILSHNPRKRERKREGGYFHLTWGVSFLFVCAHPGCHVVTLCRIPSMGQDVQTHSPLSRRDNAGRGWERTTEIAVEKCCCHYENQNSYIFDQLELISLTGAGRFGILERLHSKN